VTLASLPEYFAAGAAAVGAGSELAGGSRPQVAAAARSWLDAARAARAPMAA
jgi:2-keto-3-deoxy-6-phosphogluconate aldolase